MNSGAQSKNEGSIPTAELIIAIPFLLCGIAIWRHISHPLYRFPGPFLAAWSNLPFSYKSLQRRWPFTLIELHKKYGPVVRIAPNELSFDTARSWKDIYGSRPGHLPFCKSEFYDGGFFSGLAYSVITERDPSVHAKLRKTLLTAFSDRSLKEQEYLIDEGVNEFISELGAHAAVEQGSDLALWVSLATFDIIGSLAFGESFGGLKTGKMHHFLELAINSMRKAHWFDIFNRFPLLAKLYLFFFPKVLEPIMQDTKEVREYTLALVEKRQKNPSERPDFLTLLLKEQDGVEMSNIQIAAHALDLVFAGTETIAMTLISVNYHLLRYPDTLQKLQMEVRAAFNSSEDITAAKAANLKYLHAAVLEGMRIFAPAAFSLSRLTPPGGDSIDGCSLPAGVVVSVNPFAASLSPANFDSPLEYRPERWLGSNTRDILEASQPFSLGSRACLGRSLAWVELNLILAKLHFTYDIEFLNGDQLDLHRDSWIETLWSKPELRVRVSPRG